MNEHLKIQSGKLFYYNTPIAFVDTYDKVIIADSIFRTKELELELNAQWIVRWADGVFEKLIQENSQEKPPPVKTVRIWQLANKVDSSYKFIPYQQFEPMGGLNFTIADYECIYDGMLPTNHLDEIYSEFQLGTVEDYHGRNLAMGDVIELYDHTERQFYYIDKVGFQKVELK